MGFSDVAIYTLGVACVVRSIMAFTNPQAEYKLNGLKHIPTSKNDPSSEPIYMLGIWELSIGILLIVYQMNSNLAGVTSLLGLMGLYKAGVGILLGKIGGSDNFGKIVGNIITTLALWSWALYLS
ncbi:gluconate 5-dehydrogenase [Fusarium heterosporum]|uniref:Gluconate 5-dehydrogenase n=1 Tax=Fusarium heterosporum TaxID=42747 RepID=A0A8H5TC96_FUSHE|nr:gluconate 5-dehydrogenase [Fusarium heterosporum]